MQNTEGGLQMYKNFMELAENRYSVRKYKKEQISKEDMEFILHAGQVAPTAANVQSHRIFVLQSEEAMAKVKQVTRFHYNAPTVLLICSNTEESYKAMDGDDSGPVDAAIVTTHMMMEAFDIGVGSCWVRGFDENQVRAVFDLPEHLIPVAMLDLGYPTEDSHPWPGAHEKRRPLSETVIYQ